MLKKYLKLTILASLYMQTSPVLGASTDDAAAEKKKEEDVKKALCSNK